MEATQPRKKFAITACSPPYEPAQRTKPLFSRIRNYDSNASQSHSVRHRLYITREAMEKIFNHIEWGEQTERNIVEQGGILLGHVFRDKDQELTYGVAETAIAGSSAKGSSASLELTHETWKQMLDSVDELLNQNPPRNLQVIGWYHTHPNNLDVYMSGTDRGTQSRLFSHDWQFAIVMNPHREIWRAFYGINAHECKGFVVEDIQDSESEHVSEKLPPDESEHSEKGSIEEVEPAAKISRQETGPNRLKKITSKFWHSDKMFFRKWQKDQRSRGDRGRISSNQSRQFPNTRINESKINFFLWLFGIMLFLTLLFQAVIVYLLIFSSDKK